MRLLRDINCPNLDTLIGLAVFGSYNTEYWQEGRSDIDILILLEYRQSIGFEFKVEDTILPILREYFSYENIHITFLYMNEFDSPLAKCFIKSENKLIINDLRYMDFRLYVNKYLRNNQWLESLIKSDKQMLRR